MDFDDFNYALENTVVHQLPQKRLETFGTTVLNYHLITEEMDAIDHSIVREGRITAERPQIITPHHFHKLLLEGFGEQAEQFAGAINQAGHSFAVLKYGFQFSKAESNTNHIHEPLEAVLDKVKESVRERNDPMAVILSGVDDGWEVCLLKFMMDMVASSGQANIQDFRNKGFLPPEA